VVAAIPVNLPERLAVTPDGTRALVTGVDASFKGIVSVIDTTTNTVVATIPLGSVPENVAITPDGTHAYVSGGSTISVIDTASNAVVDTITLGEPVDVVFTPDGAHAYVVNLSDRTVKVLDTTTNAVVDSIQAGFLLTGIAITPDGTGVLVISLDAHFMGVVSVIDTTTNTVVATIPAEGFVRTVAITPDGAHAYVTSEEFNAVLAIDTASNTIVATIPVGAFPFGVALFNPPTPQSQINHIIAAVQALVNAGTLNGGQGNSLIVSLEHALRQPKLAIGQLQTFIGKVNTFVSQNDLTQAQGQPLIDAANAVIHSLGG
jgi:YVTN family beta-propeller protein